MQKPFLYLLVSASCSCLAANPFCAEFLSVAGAGGAGHANLGNGFENFVADEASLTVALDMARAFVAYEGRDSIGLFLQGQTGVGKTHLAMAITRDLIESKKARVLYVGSRNFMDEWHKSNKQQDAYFSKYDALIFDDPALNGSDWLFARLYLESATTVFRRLGGRKILLTHAEPLSKYVSKLYAGSRGQNLRLRQTKDVVRSMFQATVLLPLVSRRPTAQWYQPETPKKIATPN